VAVKSSQSIAFRLRAFYRRLIRRRQDRLIILREASPAFAFPPIFLVGCPRSGTSLLRRLVDSHSRIACPPESHFIHPLLQVLADHHSMLGLASMGFPREQVLVRLRALIDQFFIDYAQANNKVRWADKTPLYVDSLDAIDELYEGTARYVTLYRHGLDVTHSMVTDMPGFVGKLDNRSSVQEPRDPVRVAAAYWRDQVGKMRVFQTAHADRCFELRYEALVTDPERVLRDMFAFLGEPFEPQVLRFNEQRHDPGLEDGKVGRTTTFEPSIGNYRKWKPAQLDAAVSEAEPALSVLDYRV
jgi:hypothetical protein